MKLPKLNTKFLSFLSYGPRVRPFRDWFVLISIGVLLLLASAGWNTWLFYRIFNGEALAPVTAPQGANFSTEALTKAEALFSARATEEGKYKTEYRFVDPSL